VKGTKPDIVQDKAALMDVPRAPVWLSKDAKAEWRRILPILIARKILTDADMGSVENYCVAIGHVRAIARELAAGFDAKLFRAQNQAMQTSRQLAAELGLTPVSRSRPAMREDADDADALLD
jgi:phage terminase small subunit